MTSVGERPVTESAPPPVPRRGRRWRRLGYALVVVIVLGVIGFVVAAETVSLVRHAKRAQASLESFKTALKAGDNVAASRNLAAANAELARAHKSYESFPLSVLGSVPVLGWPVSDAGHLLHAADDVSVAGSQALNLYDQVRGSGSKLFHNSTVNLRELQTVTGNADSMVARMDAAAAELHRVRAAWWEPSVGAARDKALAQVSSLRAQGADAQKFLDLAPGLVGANGPRSYLIAVLNPAELEGAGGAALNMLTVRFDRGHMKILQSGSTFDLTNENTPTRFKSLPSDPWLRGSSHVLAAVDRSPDFRTSGEELMRGYTAQFHRHLDGVIALDPVALSEVMTQIPPFTTPGYGLVTADNIVKTVLVDSYTKITDKTLRHAYNDALMNTLLHQVLQGGHMPEQLGGEGQSQRARHVTGRRGHAGGNIFLIGNIHPFPVGSYIRRGEMRVHLPPGAVGIVGRIRIGIQLGEEFGEGCLPRGKSEGLIPVIARKEVTRLEKLGGGYLGHFFTVAKNAEFGFAGKYLLAAEQAGFPAFASYAVVLQHFFPEPVERKLFPGKQLILRSVFHGTKISILWAICWYVKKM